MNIFESASREKLRFDSPVGNITAEDLWDLPLTSTSGRANLDDIAKGLHRELKLVSDEVSFVKPAVKTSGELELKFEVVKRVIEVRVAERDAAKVLADRQEKKQRILELLAKKQDDKLSGASEEELHQMLESM